MITFVTTPTPTRPIIQQDMTADQEFQSWIQIITNQALIIGTGSPEGVVQAVVGANYMDDAGTAGNIKYIKRDADIAGDKAKGWILI